MAETYELKIDVIEDNNRLLFLPEGGDIASTVISSMWFGQMSCHFNLKRQSGEPDIRISLPWSGGMDSKPYFLNLRQIFGSKAYPDPAHPDYDRHQEMLARPLTAGDQLTAIYSHDLASETIKSFKRCHAGVLYLLNYAKLPNNSKPTANGLPVIDHEQFKEDALPYYRKEFGPNKTDGYIKSCISLP